MWKQARFLLIVNVLGVAAFLYFASWEWAPTGQSSLVGGPGDPFVWMLTAFPAFAACSLVNIFWFLSTIRKAKQDKPSYLNVAWLAIVIIWIGAFRYDAHNSYQGTATPSGDVPSRNTSSVRR